MIAWLIGGLIVGLVALYLINPPIRRLDLSAARFFEQLQEPPRPRPLRVDPRRLVSTPLFWLQLLALLLLLAAALAWRSALAAELGPRRIGLLLAIDTSASMRALQGGSPRLRIAQLQAVEALSRSQAAAQGGAWCARIAGFDLEWRELGVFRDPAAAAAALAALDARALGGDLELVREAAQLSAGEGQECQPTHVVVVTDQPVPAWQAESSPPLIWLDIAEVVANVGFTAITPVRNALTGAVDAVGFQVGAFGPPPAVSRVTISGPGGFGLELEHSWGETVVWEYQFAPQAPGVYTLSLGPDGVYALDDSATLLVGAEEPVRIDWRLPDQTLLAALGWQQDSRSPQVRAVALSTLAAMPAEPTGPLLLIGPGYAPEAAPRLIGDFDEASPLLADLNLDVAEAVGMQPAAPLPPDFVPVLTGEDGAVWIAARPDHSAIYVPGPPQLSDDDLGAFSQTVFFNALRELLGRRAFPPLSTLTTPEAPEPEGNRLALHPGEGDTGREPQSAGSLDDWRSGQASGDNDRLWPPILAAALAAVALERAMALMGGRRWS
jgi:hypothetical protein